jgi:hypothetical protein
MVWQHKIIEQIHTSSWWYVIVLWMTYVTFYIKKKKKPLNLLFIANGKLGSKEHVVAKF